VRYVLRNRRAGRSRAAEDAALDEHAMRTRRSSILGWGVAAAARPSGARLRHRAHAKERPVGAEGAGELERSAWADGRRSIGRYRESLLAE
jgi:hypothetical protein